MAGRTEISLSSPVWQQPVRLCNRLKANNANNFMNSGRGNAMNGRSKIRYGMVGGGEGAFIGAVHRMAAALDSEYELLCGAFSADADRNRRSAEVLGLDPGRAERKSGG